MPKRILVLGILFCISGAVNIYDIISAAIAGKVYLAFGALMLPVGIGLLRGKASSQWWARLWMILLGYCLSAVLVALCIFSPANAQVHFFKASLTGKEAILYTLAFAAAISGLAYGGIRLLYSEKASAFFRQRALEERRQKLYPERSAEA